MKTTIYNEQMLDAVIEDMRNLLKDGKHINLNYEIKKKEKTKAQIGFWFGALCSSIYDYFLDLGVNETETNIRYGLYEQVGKYVPEIMIEMVLFGGKQRAMHIDEIQDRMLMAKFIDGVFEVIENEPLYAGLQLHPSVCYNWAFHVKTEDIKFANEQDLPERDERYLEYIRTRPCIVCGRMNRSEAHHVKIKELVALGKKTPDWTAVPLCHKCHMGVAHGTGFREAMAWLPIKMLDFCRLNYVRWIQHMGR